MPHRSYLSHLQALFLFAEINRQDGRRGSSLDGVLHQHFGEDVVSSDEGVVFREDSGPRSDHSGWSILDDHPRYQ